MAKLELSEQSAEGHPLFVLAGELTHANAPDLRRALLVHIRERVPVLVIDMSGVTFMDTSGLATLIEAHNQVTRYKGRVILADLQPQIAQVFEVTRVGTLFAIFDTAEEAVASLSEGAT